MRDFEELLKVLSCNHEISHSSVRPAERAGRRVKEEKLDNSSSGKNFPEINIEALISPRGESNEAYLDILEPLTGELEEIFLTVGEFEKMSKVKDAWREKLLLI